MPMYNLLEYSNNYSRTSGSLWNYYRDEVNDNANENNPDDNHRLNNNKTTTSNFFYYKTKVMGSTPTNNNVLDTSFSVSLNLLLINREIELDLPWWEDCIISKISRTLKYLLIQLLIHLLTVFHQHKQITQYFK